MRQFLFYILIFLFLCTNSAYGNIYDINLPLEGDSVANDELQFITLKQIYSDLIKQHPSCTDFSVKDTQLIHYPFDAKKKNNKYIKGYWKELWTVNHCGETTQIPITFYINKNKTDYKIEYNIIKN